MSETTGTPTPESTSSSPENSKRCSGRRRGRFGRKVALLAVFLVGLAGLKVAFAGGGHCGAHDGPPTAEGVREHMAWATDHALDRVDAPEDQYKAVDAILDESAPKLAGFAGEGHALRGQLKETLVADPTDRAALETVRTSALALADRASAAALDDLVKLASVLTPEQRQELAQTWEKHNK